MIKKYIIIFIIFISIIGSKQASAQNNNAVWTVEVISAHGLKNTDLWFNGVSDPFVDIYLHSSKGDHFNEKTPVIFNNVNPEWHYTVKREYAADEKLSAMIFVVWDQDNIGNRFLGVARLSNPIPGQEYSLRLHRRRLLNTPTEPGPFLMPGTLKVRVTSQIPSAMVPNIKGKTKAEAKDILKSKGFLAGSIGSVYTKISSQVGKIVSQFPRAGEKAPIGSMVKYYAGIEIKYSVPNAINRKAPMVKKIFRQFKNIKVVYKIPPVDTPRSSWMKVVEQSPKPHTLARANTEINLVVLRPPQDFKLVVPDVVGNNIEDAVRTLKETNMPRVHVIKQRIAELENNSKVLSQNPEAGDRIPWSDEKPLTVTVGWYADGKSLYAAKPTEFQKPFDVLFDKPNSAEYRLLKVDRPGYLILNNIGQCGITPLSNYYRKSDTWELINNRRDYLPCAERVTPGEWVVQIEPEMSGSTSKRPCRFEFDFIEEFDPAEPNNNFDQAVETAPNTKIILGFIGEGDSDYYHFEVKKAGYLEVSSEELPSEIIDSGTEKPIVIKYSIFDEKQQQMGQSYYLSSASYLAPGKYYIAIYGEIGWSLLRYKVTLQFHEAKDVGEPNNTPDTAYEVQAGTTIPVAYSISDEDYYLIKSDKPGYAVLSHDRDIPFDIDFNRYDDTGRTQGPMVYLPAAVRIDGKRLVSLSAKSEGHGYLVDPPVNLQIGFISADQDRYEPNDTSEEAASIDMNKTIKGLLMPRFDLDNYSFIVKKEGKVFLDLVKAPGVDIPIKGKLLSSDGRTVIADNLYLPCEVDISMPGKYILRFGQEPGFRRLCEKQYRLTIRDGHKESALDNRLPDKRYGKEGNTKCIDLAKKAYQFLLAKKYRDAKELYQKALQCLPNNEVIWNDYAISCYRLKENDTAEGALKKAIELNNNYALAYRNLAFVLWQRDDYESAVRMASKAVKLDASDKNLRYAAHAYILLFGKQSGEEKRKSLQKAAQYYKMMKDIPEASKENLDKIEKFLKEGKL